MNSYDLSKLSKRERQVLQLFAAGYRASEIAAKLFVSDKTVHTHKARVKVKFDVNDSVEWMTLLRQLPVTAAVAA